uniref:TLC domain-containing protein n=2 Tax=Meloidogyne hapla TaxID=6305 RepID=A0A1I8B464_MELHA
MSFGYLVHDFIDLVVNERSARIIELLFHHVVVLTGFMLTHITGQFLYIVVIGLLMEVNSIFLHTRSLMNLYRQKKNSTAFKIGWLFYHYMVGLVQWHLQVINSLLVFSLTTTNCVLFYRVLAADGLLGENRARALSPERKDKRNGTAAQNVDSKLGHSKTITQEDDKADETDHSSNDDEEGTSDESDNRKVQGTSRPRSNYIEVPTHPTSSQEVFIVKVEN